MHKFKFNLEKLLKIREHDEHEYEIKLGQAVSKCVRIENDIKHCFSEIDRMIDTGAGAGLSQEYLLSMDMYRRRMNADIETLQSQLTSAREEMEKVRADYLEASKKRKVLTKLKEKREAEYYKQQRKNEFNEIDEMNNGRAAARAACR
ncbi:MAG: flagellar export protein FliJ [Spirochaetales bacterium]|nr:flagellar export protein FliJ [Spirochaetales bacterium]